MAFPLVLQHSNVTEAIKSGSVFFEKGVKYHEPEHWKFGEEGNNYLCHASGHIYAISKCWLFIFGNTNCEWEALLIGRGCAATYERKCSGIRNTSERIKEIHETCIEDQSMFFQTDREGFDFEQPHR